ncbi:hypothetical protein E2C01_015697 [Portunus trituberculatus]|uniref:Uncharacterized protein n=1 Tax=Portunus trituberculatus TaxID=210409 RepID=A0A5B7DNH8_PORTR|nr:hypothetical protein [Portunus trituberculatus]
MAGAYYTNTGVLKDGVQAISLVRCHSHPPERSCLAPISAVRCPKHLCCLVKSDPTSGRRVPFPLGYFVLATQSYGQEWWLHDDEALVLWCWQN